MTEVKDRPIDKLARNAPNFWKREWHKRDCKGCQKTFMPEARSQLYCKPCSEAGKGWAGRKDKQRKGTAPNPGQTRQDRYPYDQNVLVERKGAACRFKPFGACTINDLSAVADRQYGNANGTFGEQRRHALYQAETYAALAGALRSSGSATVGDLPIIEVTRVFRDGGAAGEERRAA